MTEHRETTRYATPSLVADRGRTRSGTWIVTAHPYREVVGRVRLYDAGWTAVTPTNAYAGLWPTKQAAAEVLVRQAGYEVGEL